MIAQTAGQPRNLSAGKTQPGALPALTGLRFFAALAVVAVHFGIIAVAGDPLWVRNIVSSGALGVNVFFILSGFILTYTYMGMGGTLRATRRAFWIARVARIYPLYVVAFVFAAYPSLRDWEPSWVNPAISGIASLLLLQAWIYQGTNWNSPAWSLSDEAFFYLLFPTLAPLVGRIPPRALAWALAGFWFLGLLPVILLMVFNPDHVANVWLWENGPWAATLAWHPLARLPEFLFGVTLACIFQHRRATLPAWLPVVALAIILLILAQGWTLTGLLPQFGLFDPLFGLMIYGLAGNPGGLARVLASPLCLVLGEASYALYLLHVSVWRYVATPTQYPPNIPWFLAYLLVAVLLSIATFRFIEQPARRAIRRRWLKA